MNFIKALFKARGNKDTTEQKPKFPWIDLNSINQLEQLLEESKSKPIVIFKHSTGCGISRMVLKRFEKQTANLDYNSFYYLDLLRYRDISNTIAEKFEVVHQSPQLIVLKSSKVVAHDSHHRLLEIAL